jgi:hypothetical protein
MKLININIPKLPVLMIFALLLGLIYCSDLNQNSNDKEEKYELRKVFTIFFP